MSVKATGLAEALTRFRPETLKQPVERFMERAGNEVLNEAKPLTAVDRDLLRASLAKGAGDGVWEVEGGPFPTELRVGTRVSYAAAVEHGGGDLSDDPAATAGWRFPTPDDLAGWARRKGADARRVALAIRRRGGVAPKPYLRPGLEKARPVITGQHLDTLGKEIAEEMGG
jgi:hypothetical protein